MSILCEDDYENIIKEITSQLNMNHPNIIKLYDFFVNGQMIYMLLEYVPNGNIFYFLNKNHPLPQKDIAKLWYQTVLAIQYIHNRKYIHRDLKPENLLLDSDKNLRLCDFGWCCHFDDTEYKKVAGGTYEYMAPETLRGEMQGPETDLWALGVLLFELFHNKEPYKGKSQREMLACILKTDLKMEKIPEDARTVIRGLLKMNPRDRMTPEQLLESKYLRKFGFGKASEVEVEPKKSSVVQEVEPKAQPRTFGALAGQSDRVLYANREVATSSGSISNNIREIFKSGIVYKQKQDSFENATNSNYTKTNPVNIPKKPAMPAKDAQLAIDLDMSRRASYLEVSVNHLENTPSAISRSSSCPGGKV